MLRDASTLILLCFVALFAPACTALNQCGGDKPLGFVVGELCESQLRDGCPFGRIACQGANSVACIPSCDITFKQIVSSSLSCKNSGVPMCKCPLGYSGRECETRDACAGLDCGAHGVCENGSCVCEAEYMGTYCDVRRDCVGSNFAWTGSACVCAANYEGPRCERCAADLLCVPLDKNGRRYGPVHVSNETILLELLNDPPPAEYTAKPRKPSPLTLCSCEINSGETASFFHADDDDDDDEFYPPDVYIHRYYRGYRDHDDCSFYLIAVIIGSAVVLLLVIGGCLMSQPAQISEERAKKPARRAYLPEK